MSRILMLDECGDPEIVGNLGASLFQIKKTKLRVVDGFIIPAGQNIEYGLSNEILRAFDNLEVKRRAGRRS